VANIPFTTAWQHIRRAPFQAMAAIFVLTITFFVTTVLSILVYSSSQVLKYFETRPQIIAFIKSEATIDEISSLQRKLNDDSRVREVTYVSKEQALEIYKEATSNNPLLSELVSPSIFPASLEFSLKDLSYTESVIDETKKENIVDEIGFTASLGGESTLSDVVSRLRTITWYIRLGGGIFVTFLLGTSFLVLTVIIGMRMTTRRTEIEILDLIGATLGFIRLPVVLEALIYTIIGVLLGWVFALVGILYLTPSLIKYFGAIPVLPKDTLNLLTLMALLLGGELFIGIVLSMTGAMIALSRVRLRR